MTLFINNFFEKFRLAEKSERKRGGGGEPGLALVGLIHEFFFFFFSFCWGGGVRPNANPLNTPLISPTWKLIWHLIITNQNANQWKYKGGIVQSTLAYSLHLGTGVRVTNSCKCDFTLKSPVHLWLNATEKEDELLRCTNPKWTKNRPKIIVWRRVP